MRNQTALKNWLYVCSTILALLVGVNTRAQTAIPDKPSPPRLVVDMANMLSGNEEDKLETKLEGFARTTSTQITVVTITDLQGYDVSDYAVKLFNKWGVGQKGKNNGVLLLVARNDRKAWITTGTGLQGVLTDAKTSRIFRNELRPAFKNGNYYIGIDKTADAIIAVTKDEYKADNKSGAGSADGPGGIIILIIIFIVLVIIISRKGGGGGGGYINSRRAGDFMTGWLIGNMLNSGRGSSWGGGGSDWGGGGFGGFGGGSSDGGGAGGSW
jgi:uncharacterized protein